MPLEGVEEVKMFGTLVQSLGMLGFSHPTQFKLAIQQICTVHITYHFIACLLCLLPSYTWEISHLRR